jgi:Na+-transporting NADH:ubiquinone oxidoreductase subunit NqrF
MIYFFGSGDPAYYMRGSLRMNETVLSMLDYLGVPSRNIAPDDFGG